MSEIILNVKAEDAGKRIDVYISGICGYTRSFVQNLIEDEYVKVSGKKIKNNYKLKPNDVIEVKEREASYTDILPQNIALDILYEDDDVIVINKPKNMVVHISAGHYEDTLVNALMYHCKNSLSGINGVMRPGIVHRIDKDTTGALIVCKNDKAHISISEQLKEHSISRKYRAIVKGKFKEDTGVINMPIKRHKTDRKKMQVNFEGKHAVTHYKVLETYDEYSYIECELETGRTHQIRVHMSYINHPLMGDMIYSKKYLQNYKGVNIEGQCLHAQTIGFIHPSNGEYIEVEAPLPEYFEELLKKLRK